MGKSLTCMLTTLMLSALLSSEVATKKSIGADMVPAGTAYSPGVLVGNTLYISGLQGTDPETHDLPTDFDQEVKNCLNNIGTVLKRAGMSYSNVVSVQVFLVDISQFQKMNSIYKQYFGALLPARTTVEVGKLSLGARIEIAVVAQK